MKIFLARRAWFDNEAGLAALERFLKKSDQFKDINASLGNPLEVCFDISSNESLLSKEQRERGHAVVRRMQELGFETEYNIRRSSEQKYIHHLFQKKTSGERSLWGLSCIDQFPLEEEKHIARVCALGKRVLREGTFYGNGLRSIPVVLGIDRTASDLRAIHELALLLSTNSLSYNAPVPFWAHPSPHYAQLGELVSGFYLFNPHHSLYSLCQKEILQKKGIAFERADAQTREFAVEYFVALCAGLSGQVSSEYVYSSENRFYRPLPAMQERERTRSFILRQTALVGATSMRPCLEEISRKNKKFSSQLSQFFDTACVDETLGLIEQGLTTSLP